MRIPFSPYTYARIAVMRSRLFRKQDYERLLKMGYHEALRYVQDNHPELKLEADIDHALNASLMQVVGKLYRISNPAMQEFVRHYAMRYDMENIKVIIRSKFAGLSADEVRPALYPSLTAKPEELLLKNTVDDVLMAVPFLKQARGKELFEIENMLDKYYLESLYAFAQKMRGESSSVARFLLQEIEGVNIKTILRLLPEQRSLEQYVVRPSSLVQAMLRKKNVAGILAVLRKEKRTTLDGSEPDILVQLEMELDSAVLRKEALLMHQEMLSAQYIIGFLFAKEIEVRNVRTLIKGKKLSVKPDYLEKMLVIGS